MKILNLLLGFVIATPAFAQAGGNVGVGEFKSTATIENSCLIAADNVNFGQVFAPLTTQGTQSQMKVLCSKDASYTINLAYGGVYGSVLKYSFKYKAEDSTGALWDVTDSNNLFIGSISCVDGNKVYFWNSEVASLYKATVLFERIPDVYGACSGRTPNSVASSYAYGLMKGSVKGDKLAYKITVPGDITKVWNAGNNSYTATGTGAEQVIEMKAHIVPGNSSSLYVAQDIYTDTVTAVISY